MKRICSILLTVFLILAVFTGCGYKTALPESATDGTASTVENTASLPETARTINGVLQSFTASTLDGKGFTVEKLAKYELTVINFWGTYCGPCIQEMPDLAILKNSLPDNVNFITFCIDAEGNEDAAQEIIDNAGLTATVITNADGDFMDVLNQIQYIPTTLFIDKNGNIVGSEIIGGVDSVEQTYNAHIQTALAEAAGDNG